MPRYFFDLHNDINALDMEGKELPDEAAAIDRAFVEAREMIKASVDERVKIDLHHFINVRQLGGEVIRKLTFEEALPIERDGKPI